MEEQEIALNSSCHMIGQNVSENLGKEYAAHIRPKGTAAMHNVALAGMLCVGQEVALFRRQMLSNPEGDFDHTWRHSRRLDSTECRKDIYMFKAF